MSATSQAAYQRQRREANRSVPRELVPHGINGYSNYDCRCGVCRAANAQAQRAFVQRWRENGPASHGIAGYKAGCRCPACRSAKSTQAAAYRARVKARRAAEAGAS